MSDIKKEKERDYGDTEDGEEEKSRQKFKKKKKSFLKARPHMGVASGVLYEFSHWREIFHHKSNKKPAAGKDFSLYPPGN